MMKTFLVLIGIAGLWQEAYAGVFGSKYYMREHGLKWSGWCVEYDGEDGVYQCSMTMKDDDQEILVQYDAELISSGDFIHIERSRFSAREDGEEASAALLRSREHFESLQPKVAVLHWLYSRQLDRERLLRRLAPSRSTASSRSSICMAPVGQLAAQAPHRIQRSAVNRKSVSTG